MDQLDVIDVSTGELVGQVPFYNGEEIAEMVDVAFAAQPRWERVPTFERGQVLYKFCDLVDERREDIAMFVAKEMGKPILQARAETTYAAEIGRANIEVGKHLYGQVLQDSSEGYENHSVFVKREALGVIACIIPFNYPAELTMQKIVPALLMGNTCIVKADNQAACCVKLIIDLAHEDFDAAREKLQLARSAEPEFAVIHEALGMTLEALGDKQGALDSYRAALRADPTLLISGLAVERLGGE